MVVVVGFSSQPARQDRKQKDIFFAIYVQEITNSNLACEQRRVMLKNRRKKILGQRKWPVSCVLK